MGLFGMAFRRVRKLIAWGLAFLILFFMGAGVLFVLTTAGVI